MEIPLMNTITGFEVGINSLENPSIISRLFPLSAVRELSESYSIWAWGAIILAAIATFSSILHKAKMVIFSLRCGKSVISDSLLRSDDDFSDDTCSSSSESDDDDDPSTTLDGRIDEKLLTDEDFRVKGRILESKWKRLRRWPSGSAERLFAGGTVKLWDEFGIGFENSGGLISMLDMNRGEVIRPFLGGGSQIPAICMPSPAVVVSAGVENMRQAALRVWDSRIGGRNATVVVEWQQPQLRRIVGIDSGEERKVFVTEEGRNSVVVRDMRKVASAPLEELTESNEQTWFDADAVMVGEGDAEVVDGVIAEVDGVIARCRNAMRSCLH